MTSLLALPALALLLIPFHDESGAVDTRNRLLGLRTRHTLASREAWDAAHAWLRRPLRRLAVVMAAVLVGSIVGEMAFGLPEALALTVAASQAVLFVGGILLIGWRANKVAAQVNQRRNA
ncbi:SdpI family protein [Nonomuraea sp. NPDC000554]|uniref:SdpI family protein n=1 Tax=Nonomuraea sp. NPDC000554 TaxID=3154259 RepID=UPI0033251E33